MIKSNAPTMKDVAREAGVSQGTVSKVVNGIAVRNRHQIAVNEAIQKLGYQVNNYARGLKTNKTYYIGVILPSLRNPFFAVLMDELTASLMRYGYKTILMVTNFDSVVEKNCFLLAQQNKIDGIIALSYSPHLDHTPPDIPFVTIDRNFSNFPCISSDNERGGELAANKLIELGCRKLLCLRIGPHIYGEVEKRCTGFSRACRAAGVEHKVLFHFDEEKDEPFRQFLSEHIQNGKSEYDGIFCITDALAVRTCNYLRKTGVLVPEDVQIIGYDGVTNFDTGQYPCSTIVQPISEMAESAVRMLLNHDNEMTPSYVTLPVKYVGGDTTKE